MNLTLLFVYIWILQTRKMPLHTHTCTHKLPLTSVYRILLLSFSLRHSQTLWTYTQRNDWPRFSVHSSNERFKVFKPISLCIFCDHRIRSRLPLLTIRKFSYNTEDDESVCEEWNHLCIRCWHLHSVAISIVICESWTINYYCKWSITILVLFRL